MPELIIRPSLIEHIDASDKILELYSDMLELWQEKGLGMDVIEARRKYALMIEEDQKRERPHIGNPRSFYRHSWFVGEDLAELIRRFHAKYPNMKDRELSYTPEEGLFAGGNHDIAKMILGDGAQHMHEHVAYMISKDNGCGDLARFQPHQPGERKVLRMIHEVGHLLDLTEKEFCRRRLPFDQLCKEGLLAYELGLLSDMRCGLRLDGPESRMGSILRIYDNEKDHLAVGILDHEDGYNRVLAFAKEVEARLS